MHFHQLILGNVSYAVLLLVICFLNNLKIAQYETFPSFLFWMRTEGELTLCCFTASPEQEVVQCSGALGLEPVTGAGKGNMTRAPGQSLS